MVRWLRLVGALAFLAGACSQPTNVASMPEATPEASLLTLARSFTDRPAHATATAQATPASVPSPVPWQEVVRQGTASAAKHKLDNVLVDAELQIVTAVNPKDGATYVYVPAGEFLMGSPPGVGAADEHPLHVVWLEGYWISQAKVTWDLFPTWLGGAADEGNSARPAQVIWAKARQYAVWAGGRLPTEDEWEKACRGPAGRRYPWPDETPNVVNAGTTANVSTYGVRDLAGKGGEWTLTSYADYPYVRHKEWETADSLWTVVVRGRLPACAARKRIEPDSGNIVAIFGAAPRLPEFFFRVVLPDS